MNRSEPLDELKSWESSANCIRRSKAMAGSAKCSPKLVKLIYGPHFQPLYLCLLIYNLTEKENEEFISRLNFPKSLAQAMRQTLQLKAQLHNLANPKLKPSDIYQSLHGYSAPAIQANALASESPVVSQHLNLYLNKLRYVKPLLNGEDLKRMGIPAGPDRRDFKRTT